MVQYGTWEAGFLANTELDNETVDGTEVGAALNNTVHNHKLYSIKRGVLIYTARVQYILWRNYFVDGVNRRCRTVSSCLATRREQDTTSTILVLNSVNQGVVKYHDSLV